MKCPVCFVSVVDVEGLIVERSYIETYGKHDHDQPHELEETAWEIEARALEVRGVSVDTVLVGVRPAHQGLLNHSNLFM